MKWDLNISALPFFQGDGGKESLREKFGVQMSERWNWRVGGGGGGGWQIKGDDYIYDHYFIFIIFFKEVSFFILE